MRRIYLIRHGEILTSGQKSRCLGHTDIPLSDMGRVQAIELERWFHQFPVEYVVSSPLSRCRETAQIIGGDRVMLHPGLCELDAGLWENLDFDVIKERFPEEYQKRGEALGTTPPPGGESFEQGGARLLEALREILDSTWGDVAIVTHSGVIRGLLCFLLDLDKNKVMEIPQPYGAITRLLADEEGSLFAEWEHTGVKPSAYPGIGWCRRISDKKGLPQNIRHHEAAVAGLAWKYSLALSLKGFPINPYLVRQAALVHDIARLGADHAREGARLLRREGYPLMAWVIAAHHGLPDGMEYGLSESSVLFLADKLMMEDKLVTLEERFEKSALKCSTPEAERNHERQYRQALAVWENIHRALESSGKTTENDNREGKEMFHYGREKFYKAKASSGGD